MIASRLFLGVAMNIAVLSQYVLPKQAITALAGKLAHLQGGRLTAAVIRWFVQRYQVNMTEAQNPDILAYKTFNAFFTRALKPGARPLATADFISPVDGRISQLGRIDSDQLFQPRTQCEIQLEIFTKNPLGTEKSGRSVCGAHRSTREIMNSVFCH